LDKSGRFRVYGIRRRFDGIALSNFRENAALHFGRKRPALVDRQCRSRNGAMHNAGLEAKLRVGDGRSD
jgi:hypothetical protein